MHEANAKQGTSNAEKKIKKRGEIPNRRRSPREEEKMGSIL